MATRTNETSNSQLGRLRERIRSTLFASSDRSTGETDGAGAAGSGRDAEPNPDAPGNLFQCSSCGTVYIDAEKRACSECETDVEQVRSTLESAR